MAQISKKYSIWRCLLSPKLGLSLTFLFSSYQGTTSGVYWHIPSLYRLVELQNKCPRSFISDQNIKSSIATGVEILKYELKLAKSIRHHISISIWIMIVIFSEQKLHIWYDMQYFGPNQAILGEISIVSKLVTMATGNLKLCFSEILWYRLLKYAV